MRGLPDPQQVELRIASADGTGERLLVRLPAFAVFIVGSELVSGWKIDRRQYASKRERSEIRAEYHPRGGWQA